ncbi:MAG: hypothetical protein E6K94_07875 [Thaumarchaeota archaeon]|nr:MAG: hypothetical protein E6K94_07875 [Nitrososphaerota archaeon]
MSICYDFQKRTMITLATIAISLTIGLLLVNFVSAVIIETDKGDCAAVVDSGKESEEICRNLIISENEGNTKNQSPSEIAKEANALNCSNPYDPMFPKTAINLCNFLHEKLLQE